MVEAVVFRSNQSYFFFLIFFDMRVTHGCINTGNYFDDPGFVPYMIHYEAEGDVKGAVLINPGGDVQFRSETTEGQEIAQKLSSLGYVTFVVHYRVRPYTMQEGVLDLARAVRYVRSHADDYQIDEEDIAIIGFSAGGILCGEEVLHYDGFVNGNFFGRFLCFR